MHFDINYIVTVPPFCTSLLNWRNSNYIFDIILRFGQCIATWYAMSQSLLKRTEIGTRCEAWLDSDLLFYNTKVRVCLFHFNNYNLRALSSF